MAERKRITLVYQHSEKWIGGAYYILNLIKALNLLPDNKKPHLTVACTADSPTNYLEEIGYPYMDIVVVNLTANFFEKVVNRLLFIVFKRRLFTKKMPGQNVYPVDDRFDLSDVKKYYYWIPDLQDKNIPHMFTTKDLADRDYFYKHVVKLKRNIVFSSENARNDFDKFYPDNQCKKVVLKFVSLQSSNYRLLDIGMLKKKFSISDKYFLVANQFWQHKNHWLILKAAKILKEKGIQVQIVLTGKEFDHRNPNYVNELKQFVRDNELENMVLFLGFIDREEQLKLMEQSVAIIQPSEFEGWSTVVEDSKMVNQYILLSDIPVHREQISVNCSFFDLHKADELAALIEECYLNLPITIPVSNDDSIKAFAENFVAAFN